MRFVGIDIGAEAHFVAIVDSEGGVEQKPKKFGENGEGYQYLLELLGSAEETLVAMEATGHYWQNLYVSLLNNGYSIAVINPLRTRRFAEEELSRTKTDAIDALGIARFAAQKRPEPAQIPDEITQELRELVRHRQRLVDDQKARVSQLHRVVDLCFPEFTHYVKDLSCQRATTLLRQYPTAERFRRSSAKTIGKLVCGVNRRKVGQELAKQLVSAAKGSVGAHKGLAYEVQVRHLCDSIVLLRKQIKELDDEISGKLNAHEIGKLLTTIDGIGDQTAALLVAELGDPAHFASSAALAAYVGVVPGLKHSGKRRPGRAAMAPYGNARVRRALFMPTISALKSNPWLRAFYDRLKARGKPGKVAIMACMRKLLCAIYSVAKNKREFVPRIPDHSASV